MSNEDIYIEPRKDGSCNVRFRKDGVFGSYMNTQDGLNQVQINRKINRTFAAAQRSFLRADPDVFMVDEMCDTETAAIAVSAALTGHLVLLTVHTNSACECPPCSPSGTEVMPATATS